MHILHPMAAASICIKRFINPTAVLTAALALVAAAAPAQAVLPAPVFGTGENLAPGARDARWKIVAAPSDFIPPEPLPYDSYVVKINGNPYNSISVSSDALTGLSYGDDRYWIFAQTFSVGSADDYSFDFLAEADNGLELFVNGTIDSTIATQPTITGGTSIGTASIFSFSSISAIVNLQAGSNTLYARLYDYGEPTGFNLTPKSGVPAPLPIFGAAAAFGASRRLKRRIRVARTAATAGVGQSAPERV